MRKILLNNFFIDSFLVFLFIAYTMDSQAQMFTDASFNSKSINIALPVGSIQGSANVTSGASTYTIPITVPPGTNGIVPSLSINYNSMVGNGLLGIGWSITGLSAISRVNKSIYFDNEVNELNFSSSDRFALDGVRLITKSGAYGTNEATYSTEAESFGTIISYIDPQVQGSGASWFKVISKDGVITEYGHTEDSRKRTENGNYIIYWYISKIIYPDGNYITYTYDNNGSENKLIEINYTGNTITGQLPYNKIKFSYVDRYHDKTFRYTTGTIIRLGYLLDKISITAEGDLAKSYQLNYRNDEINTYLSEIIEYSNSSTQLNSTIFKYGDKPNDFDKIQIPRTSSNAVDYFSGDVNGDGFSEIISAQYTINGSYRYYNSIHIRKRSTNNGDFSNNFNLITFPTNTILANYGLGPLANNSVADFNGDGRDDILTATIDVNSSGRRYLKYATVHQLWDKSNGMADSVAGYNVIRADNVITYDLIHPNNNFLFTGDFNGDGTADILSMLGNTSNQYRTLIHYGTPVDPIISSASNQQWDMALTSRSRFQLTSISGTHYFTSNDWPNVDQFFVLDFNGDGKSDVLLIKNNICEIFTFDGYGARRIYYSTGVFSKDNLIYIADFNGDGRSDLLIRSLNNTPSSPWTKYLSTGSDFLGSSFLFQTTPSIYSSYGPDRLTIADFNGDGKSDIYHGYNYYVNGISNSSRNDIYYSQGTGFYFNQSVNTNGFVSSSNTFPIFDINGDGRADLVSDYSSSFDTDLLFFKKSGKEHLLNKVKNGVGHVTEWIYSNLTSGQPFYKQGPTIPKQQGRWNSNQPIHIQTRYLNNIQPSLYTVSEIRSQNGNGSNSIVRFEYEDAKLHKAGKGFLGFSKITTSNSSTGLKTISESTLDTTFYIFIPTLEKTYLTSSGSQISQSKLNGLNISLGNKRYKYQLNSTELTNFHEGRITVSTNSFDANGNVISNTVTNSAETVTTTTRYGAFGPSPVASKPTYVEVSTQRAGESAFINRKRFFYSTDKGQLVKDVTFSVQADSITTSYEYHPDGNVKQKKISPTGLPDRETTESYVYDTKGRYVENLTNALLQTNTTKYDKRWGKPTEHTGVDGLKTTYEYDSFGRTNKTILPEGYTINQTYVWQVSNGSIYYNFIQHPGKPDTKTYIDLLGRDMRTEIEGMQGAWITQSQTYDSRGNIATTTQSYIAGSESPLISNNTYDEFNRVKSSGNSVFGTSSVEYSFQDGKLTTTTTDPAGKQSSQTTDEVGKIISATDDGGTLTYTYYSHGGVKTIQRDGTTIVTNEYDTYGRQTKLIDINAGTTSYMYYATGDLKTQTNANGKTSTMTYDKLGRLINRTSEEGQTIHEYYGSQGTSTNRLKKTTGFANGNQLNYTYDSYGRPESVSQTINGQTFSTQFGYNIYGDLTSKNYSTGFGIKQNFDSNGYITTITNNSSTPVTLYTTGSLNGLGQVKTYTLGNGKSSTNTYHYGTPTNFSTSGIQNLTLDWNYINGNLNFRKDEIKGKQENFTYDNLNRLETSTVPGSFPIVTTINYSSNGNISSKSDAGAYQYLPGKPNAVELVTNVSNQIPSLQQDITFTPFLRPQKISENNYELEYTYGPDYERILGVLKQNGNHIQTRYYCGDFEKSGNQFIHYIDSPTGLVSIVVQENGSSTYYYTYTDHLGSILTVTTASGSIVAEQSFDPWGRRRNPNTWLTTSIPSRPTWLYRGFTGHEHLDEFSIINMNARLYDPILGRMLSPDDIVADETSTQAFNRYTYANNNPLSYTDPDGNTVVPIIIGLGKAMATGAALSTTMYTYNTLSAGQSLTWQGLGKSALQGAVSGAISYGIGTGIQFIYGAEPSLLSELVRASAHGVASELQGGSFASGAFGSAFGSAASQLHLSPVQDIIIGGIGGGLGSVISGGNFADGFRGGMITTATNHLMHGVEASIDPPGKLESIIPIWGSGRQAIYDFEQGDYAWAAVNTAMAISDVFLVKSVGTALTKGAWKTGSHVWKNVTRPWMVARGYAKKGAPLHHWAITQKTAKKHGLEWLANQPWNMKAFANQSLHMRAGHGQTYLGNKGYGLLGRMYFGTPLWPKAFAGSVTTRTIHSSR